MVLSEKELWKKLSNYCLIPTEKTQENLDLLEVQIYERTGELSIFNQNMSRSLSLYPLINTITEEKGYINYNYRYYCEMSLISLITSLESYLENNFRKLSNNVKIDSMDLRNLSYFIRNYNLEKKYFEALKNNGSHDFLLSEIHPTRFNFQQKNKLKSAYKLLNIDLPKIVSEKTWRNIFDKDVGYIKLRNKLVHQGFSASIQLETPIDTELISKSALNIAEFVYMLDKTIAIEYPKIKYPELYFQKAE